MNRSQLLVAATLALILGSIVTLGQDNYKPHDFDQADETDDLNRELWEFARNTPYNEVLSYIEAAQRASRARQTAEVELPNGWRIAPAGRQVDVGRLPYEAVMFAGRLVVLDTGYYFREPQEVSIVDVASGRAEKTLKINSLFPSAVVGPDGDLYISGGFDQKVYRVNKQFDIAGEYAFDGYAGGLAHVGPQQLAVGVLAKKAADGNYVAGKLAILNTGSGKIERAKDIGYFPYAVRYLKNRLYVTLLGENKLLVLDTQLKEIKSLATGRTPQEMCTDGNNLYVANTGSDSLSVVDLRRNLITGNLNLAE